MIKVQNLKKSFGKKTVHHDVSFEVKKGECLGLLGGSGAGKSIILRSLIGLEKIDSGKIEIEGAIMNDFTEREWNVVRRNVAYVFQYGALFDSMSVYENLAYPLREHTDLSEKEISKKIEGQLLEFNLEGIGHQLPSELSGGMQKRVGLARAIISGPKIVLYDEPTAGLDPANTIKIQKLILQLKKKGTTSILVTHDMETAVAVCDRICLLSGGRIMESGNVAELSKQKDNFLRQFIRGEYE